MNWTRYSINHDNQKLPNENPDNDINTFRLRELSMKKRVYLVISLGLTVSYMSKAISFYQGNDAFSRRAFTREELAQIKPKMSSTDETSQPTLYTCSHPWMLGKLGSSLFPDYIQKPLQEEDPALFTEQDIVITHPGWDCDTTLLHRHFDLRTGRKESPWNFPGKILYVNGESIMDPRGDLDYHLGYLPDSDRSVRVFWVFISFLYGPAGHYPPDVVAQIFQNKRTLPSLEKKHFLIYAASNCIVYREAAFMALAHVDTVHYAGACHGLNAGEKKVKPAPRIDQFTRTNQGNNRALFSDYRYCLVMENTKADGYITEKIITAYLSGCVPIWYGTTEVFDLFNKDSFIYYDVEHPWVAINQIKDLEENPAKYKEMLMQPVLANGEDTVNEFMSFSSTVGNGKLKKRIRSMMGVPDVDTFAQLKDREEID